MRRISLIAACAVLGACASTATVKPTSETLATMDGKSFVVVERQSPDFVAMTSGKGMFAVAGVGAAVAAGNKMVQENDVPDPAMTISRALADDLVTDGGMTFAGETVRTDSSRIEDIVALADGSEYALDVVTSGWSYIYDGFKFGDYFVGYSSTLRMIDTRTGEVVSSGFCAYDAKQAGKTPVSHETLLAHNADYIKRELADAADQCIEEFAANLLPHSSMTLAVSDEY